MTEIWSGCIDARIDLLSQTSRNYACYVLSCTQSNDAKDEISRVRVIIRDRNLLFLAHVGMRLRLVLRPATQLLWTFKTFDVVAVLSVQRADEISRSILSRVLASPYMLCKARHDRLAGETDALKDVPLTADASKYVATLDGRSFSELGFLVKDIHRLRPTLVRGLEPFYASNHCLFSKALANLDRLTKAYAINFDASVLYTMSLTQITHVADSLSHISGIELLFLGTMCKFTEKDATVALTEPFRLSSMTCEIASLVRSVDFNTLKMRAKQSQLRRIRKQIEASLDTIVDDEVLQQVTTDALAVTHNLRYGHTAFVSTRCKAMEQLGVWRRLVSEDDVELYTTSYLHARATRIVELLRMFNSVRCVDIAGGCALLTRRELNALIRQQRRRAVIVIPSFARQYDALDDQTVFGVEDVVSGANVDVRIAMRIASNLVILDCHALTEREFAATMTVFLRIRQQYRSSRLPRLLLVGDKQQKPIGWAAGAPFMDIVKTTSGSVTTLDCSLAGSRQRHYLASLSSRIQSNTAAETLASHVMRNVKTDLVDCWKEICNGAQLIFWTRSIDSVGSMARLIRRRVMPTRKRQADEDDEPTYTPPDVLPPQSEQSLEILAKIQDMPWLIRSCVSVTCPYVWYGGLCVRVDGFHTQTYSPMRENRIDVNVDLIPAEPLDGLVSLDADGLVLRIDNTPVDHMICCNTRNSKFMRVATHRAELTAASFALASDASRQETLANHVAIMVDGVKLSELTWGETAAALVKLEPKSEVSVFIITDATNVEQRMARSFTRLWKHPPSVLATMLESDESASE